MSTPENPPAFPRTESRNSEGPVCIQDSTARIVSVGGMTLRDYFAGQALEGLIASQDEVEGATTHEQVRSAVVKAAYGYADAMLKERAK